MKRPFLPAVFVFLAGLALAVGPSPAGTAFLFRERFQDLDSWQDLSFPKIPRHSTYTIERRNGTAHLRTESNGSASAIVHRTSFDIHEYPRARWRWNVENVYGAGDARRKEGDDYPLRISVLFEYQPEKASAWERITYGIARKLYGQYPPHSSLSYVWANREDDARILDSPYTDRAKMVLLEKGAARVGTWLDEEVDMLDDYRTAFGTDPPARARIAIMNDSDNTGERSRSWVEYLDVFRPDR